MNTFTYNFQKNDMKSKLQFFAFAVLFIVVSCSKFDEETEQQDPIEHMMGKMTLQEKVCQMFILRPESICPDTSSPEATQLTDDMADFFREYPAGGFCLYAKNIISPEQLMAFTSALHSLSPMPLLCIDEEGGRVARIANNDAFGLEKFESMTALAADGDEQKVYDASHYIGTYVSRFGFDIDFAPVADVNTNPENIVIGARAFSDNPQTAARMVVSYLNGLKNSGVTGCIKHFPGHGDTKNDTHTGYAASQKTWNEMVGCEMIPFKAGIAAGTEMIMTAHIAAPNVTGSDIPSTMSSVILQDKLRGELGYKGIIITDGMEMAAITQKYTSAQAAVETVKAGADIVLLPTDYMQAVNGLLEAIEDGVLDEKRIDESVYRILSLKQKKGLLAPML